MFRKTFVQYVTVCLVRTYKNAGQKRAYFFKKKRTKMDAVYIHRKYEQRVGGAHLRVIAPADNTALFKKMLQRSQPVSNTVCDLTGRDLNRRPPAPKTTALLLDQLMFEMLWNNELKTRQLRC